MVWAGVNLPVAILVWLMIYPMMVQIDFSSIAQVGKNWKGLGLTVVVNWLIKPFTMAFFACFFSIICIKPGSHRKKPISTSPVRSCWVLHLARPWSLSGLT